MLGKRLSYGNVVATVALFVALGGASYAAIQLPKESVGSKQLKRGAVTGSKIKNGAVSGAQIDEATLGTVPSAAHSSQADDASHALLAWKASLADTALLAEDSIKLGGSPAQAYGSVLSTHLKIPATNEEREWWLPVSGFSEPRKSKKEVATYVAVEPSTVRSFGATGVGVPGVSAAAKLQLVLWDGETQVPLGLDVTNGLEYWAPSQKFEIGAFNRMAMQLVEKPEGEEIPAFELETAMLISPAAPRNELNIPVP